MISPAMEVNLFHESVLKKNFAFDKEFFFEYLFWLNMSYAQELQRIKVLDKTAYEAITTALRAIQDRGSESLSFSPQDEDLILHIEKELIKHTGHIGGKLHTGRSRNDMGHTLLRMFLRERLLQNIRSLTLLLETILEKSKQYVKSPYPAVTHGQRAQIIPFSHYSSTFKRYNTALFYL